MAQFDQRWQQVYRQLNINFQIASSPDPTLVLNQGIKLLEANSYQQVINAFTLVLEIDRSMSDAYYYLALALLKGRRPKILKRSEVEEIDQLLSAATSMGDSDGTVYWFRALVRDDYYNGNRITNYPPPSAMTLFNKALSCQTNIDRLRALLARLPMFDNELYGVLVQQIL
ncbi:hypothetical protein [Limnofasciculus baicalensis]|uniref:Tetratricopeptide repeat protein n=1 Tax=Limnofasciculus baicalensis BBK-W-15 TaxID=2699891 RepID=A0AAE3GR51_9CYAN|nr:hypothetical protein [Limnofasciculus baicalensis]MCP2728328.1 hypothetical protein [Limnofasciculus baicalensis BBK-W-15]